LPQEFPEVVPLNIGGAHFTTRLSTLRCYEDTMLAAMFSGRHYIPTDSEGRYFIDRDGTHFGDVLNFLRSGDLPPRERVRAVYKEAQYYAIGPLLEQLENMQPLKGEKVRQAFLGLMPYYKDHLERIVEIARLRAVQRKARFAKLKSLTPSWLMSVLIKMPLGVTSWINAERRLYLETPIGPERQNNEKKSPVQLPAGVFQYFMG
ncbi:KCTD7 isoform 1, partial [Pan troglodytes]